MNILKHVLLTLFLVAAAPLAVAAETILQCRLLSADFLVENHAVQVDAAATTLVAAKDGGFCQFEDGSMAETQFVRAGRVVDGGAIGHLLGFIIFSFESNDSLTLSFMGGWSEAGISGKYQVEVGTGQFKGASGTGTFQGTESPWKNTGQFNVEIKVKTP